MERKARSYLVILMASLMTHVLQVNRITAIEDVGDNLGVLADLMPMLKVALALWLARSHEPHPSNICLYLICTTKPIQSCPV